IKSGSGTRQSFSLPGFANLTAGNWYRFEATFENVSATDVRISGVLENWGATGAGFVSNVLQLGTGDANGLRTFSGTDLVLGDGSVWPAFRGFADGGNARLDNFAAIPEPASIALLAMGLAACAIRRR